MLDLCDGGARALFQHGPARSTEEIGRINSRPRQTETREADPAGLEGRMASSRGRSP